MGSKGPAFRENIHRLFDEAQATDLAPGSCRSSSHAARTPRSARCRSRRSCRTRRSRASPTTRSRSPSSPTRSASTASSSRSSSARAASKFELIAGERRWRASTHGRPRNDPGDRRRVRRADRARGQHHREPPARGRLPARGGGDVPQDDRHLRLLGAAARAEGRQGQGLRREPAAPDRCARRRPRAGVRAQRHDQPRLRADEDRRRAQAPTAGEADRGRRAVAGQAAAHHRHGRAARGRQRPRRAQAAPAGEDGGRPRRRMRGRPTTR